MKAFISKDDPRLFKLWKESNRRKLDWRITDDGYEVSSHSRANHWHRVEVRGDEALCHCESVVPQCTHISYLFSFLFPNLYLEWSEREHRELAEKSLKKRQRIWNRLLTKRADLFSEVTV